MAARWLPRRGAQRRLHPLFALLGTQLTDDEVAEVADELANESDPESAQAIRHAITAVTQEHPNDADVARVRARLAAGGWPPAKPEQSPTVSG